MPSRNTKSTLRIYSKTRVKYAISFENLDAAPLISFALSPLIRNLLARKFFPTFARKFARRGCDAYQESSAIMRFQVNNSVRHFPNAIRYLNILIKFRLLLSARSLLNPVRPFRLCRFLPRSPLLSLVFTRCFFTLR